MAKKKKKKFTGNKWCSVLQQCFSNEGDPLWIGDPETAIQLTERFKIRKFFLRKKHLTLATIGWSPVKGKDGGHWYGWGKGIGDFKTRKAAEKFAQSCS